MSMFGHHKTRFVRLARAGYFAENPPAPPRSLSSRSRPRSRDPHPAYPCTRTALCAVHPTPDWALVPGYESCLAISSCGDLCMPVDSPRDTPLVVPSVLHWDGYWAVAKQTPVGYLSTTIHRLVLFAFAGPPPPGYESAHLDGNPLNAHADNLRWVTRAENYFHCHAHGTCSCPAQPCSSAALAWWVIANTGEPFVPGVDYRP
jgi:hypothetical protein